MQTVKYVQKDLKVQNYSAVSHDMVTAALREAMIEAGIVVKTTIIKGKLRDREEGAKMRLFEGLYQVLFINIEDPADVSSIEVAAHAYDNGDKSPGKAMSYAVKYALLKTFMLETGENEESRLYDPMTATATAEELVNIRRLLAKTGRDEAHLIEVLNQKGAGITELDQMTDAFAKYSVSLMTKTLNREQDESTSK